MTDFPPSGEYGRSLANVAYEHILELIESEAVKPGDVISHDELTAIMDTEKCPAYYQAMTVALKRLEKVNHRSLLSVRGHGYRLLAGTALIDKATAVHQERAKKQAQRGLDTASAVDLGDVPEMSDKQFVRQVQNAFAITVHYLSQQAEQIVRHEEEITQIKADLEKRKASEANRIKATDEQMEEIRQRIRKLEQDQQSDGEGE